MTMDELSMETVEISNHEGLDNQNSNLLENQANLFLQEKIPDFSKMNYDQYSEYRRYREQNLEVIKILLRAREFEDGYKKFLINAKLELAKEDFKLKHQELELKKNELIHVVAPKNRDKIEKEKSIAKYSADISVIESKNRTIGMVALSVMLFLATLLALIL